MKRVPARLPREVTSRIGPFYVYVLADPRDGHIFYVGKGTGDRLEAHGREAGLDYDPSLDSPNPRRKRSVIRDIRGAGLEPRIEVVRYGITELEAFALEAALIACLPELTNEVAGYGAEQTRVGLDELVVRFGAAPLVATEPPVLFIRLSNHIIPLDGEELEPGYVRYKAGWDPLMDPETLYDATRGWWRISPASFRRRGVRHAVAVAEGVTRGLYEVREWIGPRGDGRFAFGGTIVGEGAAFDAYVGSLGKRVPFAMHAQNAIHYWPVNGRRP
jgi:hypothetical protein